MGWYNVRLQMRSQLLREAKGMIRREKVGGRERKGEGRRYRYGGFYNGQEGHRVYTFLLRFYAVSTGNSRFDSRNCGYFIAGTVKSDS